MFPGASLRKSSVLIKRIGFNHPLNAARSVSSQSESAVVLSSAGAAAFGGDESRSGETSLKGKQFLRLVSSGVLAGGVGLGFSYWSGSSVGDGSSVSFADAVEAADWTANGGGGLQVQHALSGKKPRFLIGDAYRRRIFFNYEKRIRTQSPPEKVFEYFASHRSPAGEVLMTPADLMRAIVPVFSPSESDRVREGFLRGERVPGELHCPPSRFFMLFDTDSDGLISFPEYIFFVTLLSIPESSFSVAFKMFDINNNGEIDRDEFKKVMALMRSQHRQGAHHRDGRRTVLKNTQPVENGGLLQYFFGKDGKECLRHEKFVQFLRDLQEEILKLEFCHYDYKSRGTISAKDFALSLVASADINDISKLLNRVHKLDKNPQLKDRRITYDEFRDFAELRKKLQPFSLAIFSYGKVNGVLTKDDFRRAASQVCGITMTDNMLDIVFYVFDANSDGNLMANELVSVLQKRETNLSQSKETGVKGLISCWLNCAANCSTSKLFL